MGGRWQAQQTTQLVAFHDVDLEQPPRDGFQVVAMGGQDVARLAVRDALLGGG